eukprot:6465399-Amphidinium_carterae.1
MSKCLGVWHAVCASHRQRPEPMVAFQPVVLLLAVPTISVHEATQLRSLTVSLMERTAVTSRSASVLDDTILLSVVGQPVEETSCEGHSLQFGICSSTQPVYACAQC